MIKTSCFINSDHAKNNSRFCFGYKGQVDSIVPIRFAEDLAALIKDYCSVTNFPSEDMTLLVSVLCKSSKGKEFSNRAAEDF